MYMAGLGGVERARIRWGTWFNSSGFLNGSSSPSALAFDGISIWVADSATNTVSRISPE